MALSPAVFVGVGGSGGKTLRVIHQVLSDALTSIGWEHDWPEAWQFVHIEVAAEPDGIEPGLPFTLPIDDFLPMTTQQSTYRAIDGHVSRTGRNGLDHHLAWDSWRPFPPDEVGVTISLGAGQYRAVGRVAVLNNLKAVDGRIAQAIGAANGARERLKEFQDAWGRENLGAGDVDRATMIFVVSSLSGGSGSGATLDVCDVIRASNTAEASEIRAVVYAPEVFEDAQGRLDPGIAPNTFMALNELLNAWWARGDDHMPLSRQVHFSRSGVNANRPRSGPDAVFLVGRRNDAVELGTVDEIYRVVGRSLADLTLSETQQDKLGAYSSGNADALAAAIQHDVPLAPVIPGRSATRHTNLYALGFARLSTGREYFHTYAAERLAKDAALRLLYGHRLERDRGDKRTDEDLVAQIGPFLLASRLDEFGPNQNAVLDAIAPYADLQSVLNTWVAAIRAKLDDEGDGGTMPTGEARTSVRAELEAALAPGQAPGGVLPRVAADIRERALAWRRGVDADDKRTPLQAHLADLALAYAARFGLPVTRELLAALSTQVADAVKELRDEVKKYQAAYDQAVQTLVTSRPTDPGKVDASVDGYLHATILGQEAKAALWYQMRKNASQMAADLLDEVPRKLLAPIRRAIEDAEDTLRGEVNPAAGSTSVFASWPGRGDLAVQPDLAEVVSVPEHLRPGKVERTLDDVDKFPEKFLDVLMPSVGEQTPITALGIAVEQVVLGRRLASKLDSLNPVSQRATWIPTNSTLRANGEQASAAVLTFRFGLANLLARARAWSFDKDKAIGAHIRQTISEYLTDGDVGAGVLTARKDRLTSEFAELMRYAQPLVQFDADAMQAAHGIDRLSFDLVMTELDVPDDKALKKKLAEIAHAALGGPVDLKFGKQRGEMQVMTVLTSPLHPVAFRSLMEPIFTQWQADLHGENFWKYRRARPLLEWVPLTPDAQLTLAEGWVVGRLLGRINLEQQPEDLTWRIRVKAPGTGRAGREWWTLPANAPRAIEPEGALGNLLELVAMSSLEVYRNKTLDPLDPYRAILKLGAAEWRSSTLEAWVTRGEGRESTGDAIAEEAGTPEERVESLLEGLHQMELRFTEQSREPMDSADGVGDLQLRPSVEAARLGLRAVAAVRAQVQAATIAKKAGRG
jgi:hypothetical protein